MFNNNEDKKLDIIVCKHILQSNNYAKLVMTLTPCRSPNLSKVLISQALTNVQEEVPSTYKYDNPICLMAMFKRIRERERHTHT